MSRADTQTSPQLWDELEAWAEAGAGAEVLAAIHQAGGYAAILENNTASFEHQESIGRLLTERIELVRAELAEHEGWSVEQPHEQPHETLRCDVAGRQLVFRHKTTFVGLHVARVDYSVFDLTDTEPYQHSVPVLQIPEAMLCPTLEFVTNLGAATDRALRARATQSEIDWINTRAWLREYSDPSDQLLVLDDNHRVYMPGARTGNLRIPLDYPAPTLEGVVFMDEARAAAAAQRLEAERPEYGPYWWLAAPVYALMRASAQSELARRLTRADGERPLEPAAGRQSSRNADPDALGDVDGSPQRIPPSDRLQLSASTVPYLSLDELTHVLADTYLEALESDSYKEFDAAIVHIARRIADAFEERVTTFDRQGFFLKSGMGAIADFGLWLTGTDGSGRLESAAGRQTPPLVPSPDCPRLPGVPISCLSIDDLTRVLAEAHLEARRPESDQAFVAGIAVTAGRIADALQERETTFDRETFFLNSGIPDPRITEPEHGSSLVR